MSEKMICPHCRLPVRYPVIARKVDIEDFEALMKCAYESMREFGITGNLLASIKAKCAIEIAKRNAKYKGE